MTTKEVAQICGVTEKTVYNNANKANVVLEHGKAKDWTEDELKRLQLVLMKNQVNQGTQVSIVKSTVETGFQSGLTIQELISSTYKSSLATKLTPALKIQQEVMPQRQVELLKRQL